MTLEEKKKELLEQVKSDNTISEKDKEKIIKTINELEDDFVECTITKKSGVLTINFELKKEDSTDIKLNSIIDRVGPFPSHIS